MRVLCIYLYYIGYYMVPLHGIIKYVDTRAIRAVVNTCDVEAARVMDTLRRARVITKQWNRHDLLRNNDPY